ncbi:MAG: hypothetical protein MK193_15005, partial [Lentisphaeria bacterium]|nr:hypothetical protein [Lentisphaeria bacterium]
GYAHIAAKRLKVDLQNKGLAGSCHLEPVMAEWLSQSCEWDFITCEMGINMRHVHTSEIFAKRVENILKQLTNDHKDKPIIAINIYPNCLTEGWINPIKKDNKEAQQELAFNQIVREKVEQNKSKNLHFIEGSEILDDFTGLSGDLLHPDLYGHSLMGHNLAKILKGILQVR